MSSVLESSNFYLRKRGSFVEENDYDMIFYSLFLLGAFAKLQIAAISFVMSVRLHGTTRSPPDGFS